MIIAPPPTPPPPSLPPALPGGCLPGMPGEWELEPSSWPLGENQPRPELFFFLGTSSSSMSGWYRSCFGCGGAAIAGATLG